MDILQSVMDCSSHAMFTMDRQGIVTHINRQAKESFGLFNHSRHAHPAGRLLRGDMVILATTAMGQDDGALTPPSCPCVTAAPSGGRKSSPEIRNMRPIFRTMTII